MMSKTVCVNGILKEGDKVLSAPSSDYPCLIGKVVAIEPISKISSNEITTDTVIVDFMNIYGDERKNEIVECFQNLTENLELSYDEIEWCQRLRPSELIRLDDSVINNRHFYNCILNSEASAALCAYIELKKMYAKPSDKVYVVSHIQKNDGKISKWSRKFVSIHTAWEVACELFGNMRNKYSSKDIGWLDKSNREAGCFEGTLANGDYFKIQIKQV